MRKSFLTVLLLIAVLVTGCQANNTASNNATQEEVQAFSSATPEEIAAVTPPASPALEQSPVPTTPPGCTVISPKPTPGPTEQSVFPPVDDTDWQFGPKDAEITFVEYGDFQ